MNRTERVVAALVVVLGFVVGALSFGASSAQAADIRSCRFGTQQVFDVQWSLNGNVLSTFAMNYPHSNFNLFAPSAPATRFGADTLRPGDYFQFFESTTVPGTYGLALYGSDGTERGVVDETGTFRALGDGFLFYDGSDRWGTLFTTQEGFVYGEGAEFVATDTAVTSPDIAGYTNCDATPIDDLVLGPLSPSFGNVGLPYSGSIAFGGSGATLQVDPSALPPGLVVDTATGAISGTPLTAGTFAFGATLTRGAETVSTTYSITVLPPPPVMTVRLAASPSAPSDFWSGQTIMYTLTLSDTDTVDVEVFDTFAAEFTGSGPQPAIVCPTTTIPVAGTLTCTATYVVTDDDVAAGGVEYRVGAYGGGTTFLDATSDIVSLVPAPPALTLTKTVDIAEVSNTPSAVGTPVVYTFTVANAGSWPIADPVVTETVFSGSGRLSSVVCPATPILAPTEVMVCTAEYALTAADLRGNAVTNTATAAGTAPAGEIVATAPAMATTTITAPPPPAPDGGSGGRLAASGGPTATSALMLAALLVSAGMGALVVRRRGDPTR